MDEIENSSKFLFYSGENGKTTIQVVLEDQTVWATQKSMGEIFGVESNTITYHLQNIFQTQELKEISTTRKIRVVQKEGSRSIKREIDFYNLDAIVAVGYRVNSYRATQFRIWATSILKEYLIKGFTLDDERLKQGNNLFNRNYFRELLERIREIRTSERMFYQQLTDLYALSYDYDPNSQLTKDFFATVQNKLLWAISQQTAAEIIKDRANAKKKNMGLTTWKNINSGGKIIKSDVIISKNYLTKEELDSLKDIVELYLNYAENFTKRGIIFNMIDWIDRLDEFLKFTQYEILNNKGKVSKLLAERLAIKEYNEFRIFQDLNYVSDFDKAVKELRKENISPEGDNNLQKRK